MTPNVYPYEPLTSGDVFRYIVLEPGRAHEPLECRLRTANIADTDFESISYVWGKNPTKDQVIVCDGHVLRITSSLATVLRRVRLLDQPRALWADGISINQGNLLEKGHQVGLMGKIYSAASSVLIYVGSDADLHGPAVESLLQEADIRIGHIRQSVDMSWDSFPCPDDNDPILTDQRWSAFYNLLAQDWFDRGWVVQEAALAPQGRVIWGPTVLDWDVMMQVYIWLSTRATKAYISLPFAEYRINSHVDVYLENHQDYGKAFYDELSWGTPSILRTLNSSKELDLKDPRDRIYAFMDLPQWSDLHIRIKPNYFKPYLEVYQEFATQYISVTKDNRLLDYVSHDKDSLLQLPSWVPRWDISTWSVSQSCEVTSLAQSRSGAIAHPKVLEDGMLKVSGVVIDTVRYISNVFEWDTTTMDIVRKVWAGICSTDVDSPYETSESPDVHRLAAFLDSLTAGTFEGTMLEWQQSRDAFGKQMLAFDDHARDTPSTPDTGSGANTTIQETDDTTDGATIDADLYFEHMRVRTDKRMLILTERGYLGLAPGLVRVGDTCGIIFGCKTPCVLRREGREHHYKYLGATYLVGKKCYDTDDGGMIFCNVLSEEDSKDWVDWDVEEQDICLC